MTRATGPSTRRPDLLPAPAELEALCQSLAMLEAILMPDWEDRYYSFNAHWSEGERMASMRNGEGDDWFLLFGPQGTFLEGFAHESDMASWCLEAAAPHPGVVDQVPAVFESALSEPAFTTEYTTFCLWRTPQDDTWRVGEIDFPSGPDPDGSRELLAMLDARPKTYAAWASAYYEREVDDKAVARIYAHEPLSTELLVALGSEQTLASLAEDLREIGYPTG